MFYIYKYIFLSDRKEQKYIFLFSRSRAGKSWKNTLKAICSFSMVNKIVNVEGQRNPIKVDI